MLLWKGFGVLAVGLLTAAIVAYILFLTVGHHSDGTSDQPIGPRTKDSLKLVIVVSRHGNRGSTTDYPGDPYPTNDGIFWPYGDDGLTARGRKQMYYLGKKIRSLYSGFIPATYSSQDISAKSTELDRTVMSGEAFLAGLYPPMGFQVWDSDVNWQPTAFYSNSPDNTPTLQTSAEDCKRFADHFATSISTGNREYANTLNYIRHYIYNNTGINASTVTGFNLWDKLSAEYNEGFELPGWTKRIFPGMLQPYIEYVYPLAWAGTDEVIRLVVGTMYEQALNIMIQKANGSLTPDLKILYYSGHDTSILGLQKILGVSADSSVDTVTVASALVIELHQKNETQPHFVEAVYIGQSQLEEELVQLNVTSDFLTLVNSTQKYLNVDFAKECQ